MTASFGEPLHLTEHGFDLRHSHLHPHNHTQTPLLKHPAKWSPYHPLNSRSRPTTVTRSHMKSCMAAILKILCAAALLPICMPTSPHRGSEQRSHVGTVEDAKWVFQEGLLGKVLTAHRSAVLVSKRQKTVAAPTVNVFSRNASLHRCHPRRRHLYPLIRPTHI